MVACKGAFLNEEEQEEEEIAEIQLLKFMCAAAALALNIYSVNYNVVMLCCCDDVGLVFSDRQPKSNVPTTVNTVD